MDVIRACYVGTIRPYRGSNQTAKVRWYFVDDDAPIYPGVHAFQSQRYISDGISQSPVGFVMDQPVVFNHGKAPPGVPRRQLCGDPSWFRYGAPVGTPPLPRDANGLATCCVEQAGSGDRDSGGCLWAGIPAGSEATVQAVVFGPECGESTILWRYPTGGLAMGGFSEVEIA